ncbi:hypothetical protein BJ170DRAFT_698260 [Xylariales sp. AK1849]|nr:hypothetical protein BJ170DRAFT_698260 [Xylariales sp. AK1849]
MTVVGAVNSRTWKSAMSDYTRNLADNLGGYFVHDGKYSLECHIGSGEQADVFRLKKVSPGAPEYSRIAVKIPKEKELLGESLVHEVEAMKALKGAAHVVQLLEIADDPLRKGAAGTTILPTDRWIYMEWLENGTLDGFIERARRRGKPLPNRMLWRLFMCMARICIALAWPDVHREGDVRLEHIQHNIPAGILFNGDIQAGNLVFGRFIPDDCTTEHRLTPILKMIDLGVVARRKTSNEAQWSSAVSEVVQMIGDEMFMLLGIGRPADPDPTLDPDLENIVTWCMDMDENQRHALSELAMWIDSAIRGRMAAFYREPGQVAEEDDAIQALIYKLIVNADTTAT